MNINTDERGPLALAIACVVATGKKTDVPLATILRVIKKKWLEPGHDPASGRRGSGE